MSKAARLWVTGLLAAMPAAHGLSAPVLEDPTRPTALTVPAAGHAEGAPQWVLESTLIAAERRTAVINGKRVAEGDRVNGAWVVEVTPGAAVLEYGGRRIQIAIRRPQVKQPSQ